MIKLFTVQLVLSYIIYCLKFRIHNSKRQRPVVSIFGSCRQDSICSIFPTTAIRNDLTYPHSSKEILHAIRFCKSGGIISPNSREVFRSVQIGNRWHSPRSLKLAFEKTDVFVVEIASRQSYELEGDLWHLFTYGNNSVKKRIYKWRHKTSRNEPQVETRSLSDEEILNDIDLIIKELYPKKVLLVSHICTCDSGACSDLRNLLKQKCASDGIMFFDPSDLIVEYDIKELVEDEAVASRFTKFGHRILRERYRNLIDDLYNTDPFKYIVQVLEPRSSKPKSVGSHGFGDYLFGAAYVHLIALKLGRIPKVQFSGSSLDKFLQNRLIQPKTVSGNVQYIFHEDPDQRFTQSQFIFTNKRTGGPLSVETSDFLRFNCLTPTVGFRKYIHEIFETMGILDRTYSVIHVRLGDKHTFYRKGEPEDDILRRVLQFCIDLRNSHFGPSGSTCVLMSDSDQLHELARGHFLQSNLTRGHLGARETSEEQTRDTLTEFFILRRAQQILQVSIYEWGSGFSEIASQIYKIPLHHYPFTDHLRDSLLG